MLKIFPPENCPSCNSLLEWKNDILYCLSSSCGVKSQKAIEHWGKTLKIKGLGPQTIAKLEIDSFVDLYELTQESIEEALGSEKLASKLLLEIEKSKQAKLNQVLPAFGIPLIGSSATNKLCSQINNLDELTEESAREAGLGPKATDNLMDWYYENYEILYDILPSNFFEVEKRHEQTKKLKGIVCISGKLKSFKNKALATQELEKAGYTVKSSMTKDVTHLINESGIESAKTQKARAAGVEIITHTKQLLGENHYGKSA